MTLIKKFFSIFLGCLGFLILGQLSINNGLADTKPIVVCTDWTQVNDNAFRLGTGLDGTFTSEDAFEVIAFNDQLYVGMEADNSLGARLWRTKEGVQIPSSQEDWEEVIADSEGNPFGIPNSIQIDHIDSLADFNGYLYASTANRSGYQFGTYVFRSQSGNPGTWENAVHSHTAGFDDVNNENFKDMQVFMENLCGGTTNSETGAQVWCTGDGTTWQKLSHGGFGNGVDDPNTNAIWSGYVYNDALYYGVQNRGIDFVTDSDDIGILYRTSSLIDRDESGIPVWNEVYRDQSGSHRINILGDINGYIYISTQSSEGIVILRSSTGNPESWTPVNAPGMNNDPNNKDTIVDGATILNGALFVAVSNNTEGVEIWRTISNSRGDEKSINWELVADNGIGDQNNIHSQLISFNRYLYAWTSNYVTGQQVIRAKCPTAKFLILLIGDGMGANHIEATRKYNSEELVFQSWPKYWMSTYPINGNYDPEKAWDDFTYVITGTTDSAAAATAMFTGEKTANGRISVSSDGQIRLYSIADKAREVGKGVGVVTSVYGSHATPGAWYAHNDDRGNGFAIANEGLWGDPNTTGESAQDLRYDGGHGTSQPPVDVFIGAGHPTWNGGDYISPEILQKLIDDSHGPEEFVFVEQIPDSTEGGETLIQTAQDPHVSRLAALYGGSDGHLDYRLADGTGANPQNASLEEMTTAALEVLGRDPNGFVLLIEGGAIDWASHANNMDQMIGEMIDFNNAVQIVSDWVDSTENESNWSNTLVIITGDHETGYLTSGSNIFPHNPLGIVSDVTLALEKPVANTNGLRASWEDQNNNSMIEENETIYWAWNTDHHTNSLIPLFTTGSGAELFNNYLSGMDPIRGNYLDNTDIFKVLDAVTLQTDVLPESYNYLPMIWKLLP